jgi:hypothetical protein
MATICEKRPGVWEVRVSAGSDVRARPTQLSRTRLRKAGVKEDDK